MDTTAEREMSMLFKLKEQQEICLTHIYVEYSSFPSYTQRSSRTIPHACLRGGHVIQGGICMSVGHAGARLLFAISFHG